MMLKDWSLPDLVMIKEAYEDFRDKKSKQTLEIRGKEIVEAEGQAEKEARLYTKQYRRCMEVLEVINQKIAEYE